MTERRLRGSFVRPWAATLLVAVAACHCDDAPPPDDTFDGNVVTGDARPSDSGFRMDGMAVDAGEDSGTSEDGGDGGDGGLDPDAGRPDAGPDCAPAAMFTLTATEAAANAAVLDGMMVDVTGTLVEVGLSCTDRACPPENPCCNTCVGSLSVEGVIELVESECFFDPPPGCGGPECAVTCTPPVLGIPRTFRGRVVATGSSTGGPGLALIRADL